MLSNARRGKFDNGAIACVAAGAFDPVALRTAAGLRVVPGSGGQPAAVRGLRRRDAAHHGCLPGVRTAVTRSVALRQLRRRAPTLRRRTRRVGLRVSGRSAGACVQIRRDACARRAACVRTCRCFRAARHCASRSIRAARRCAPRLHRGHSALGNAPAGARLQPGDRDRAPGCSRASRSLCNRARADPRHPAPGGARALRARGESHRRIRGQCQLRRPLGRSGRRCDDNRRYTRGSSPRTRRLRCHPCRGLGCRTYPAAGCSLVELPPDRCH